MAKREKLTVQQVVEALKATSGLVYMAADKLGVSARTVYRYAERHKEVKEVSEHQKGKRHDTAEASLWNAVLKGEAWAVCFYLKTQCKDRGYIERTSHEHSGPSGMPIESRTEHHGKIEFDINAALAEGSEAIAAACRREVEERLSQADDLPESIHPDLAEIDLPEDGQGEGREALEEAAPGAGV